jgi:hypothetical protein
LIDAGVTATPAVSNQREKSGGGVGGPVAIEVSWAAAALGTEPRWEVGDAQGSGAGTPVEDAPQ